MKGYTTREVAEVLGLPASKILAWTRSGLLSPQRRAGGSYLYCFQDIVLLRTARGLLEAEVPSRTVHRALEAIRRQLPTGRPLSAVQVSAVGDRVLVRDGGTTWDPDSGQLMLEIPTSPPPGPGLSALQQLPSRIHHSVTSADDWYDRGVDLEVENTAEAMLAYRRALDLEPRHADAHLNFGRLLHERLDLQGARGHYQAAAEADPGSARARYNLGVVLEDLGRPDESIEAYREALERDDHLATAHFNLARLYEMKGREPEALSHLLAYKRLLHVGKLGG